LVLHGSLKYQDLAGLQVHISKMLLQVRRKVYPSSGVVQNDNLRMKSQVFKIIKALGRLLRSSQSHISFQ
jgi:hypothetical protein